LTITQTPCLKDFPANKFIKAKVGFFAANGELLEVQDTII